jgi:hypothetical protein
VGLPAALPAAIPVGAVQGALPAAIPMAPLAGGSLPSAIAIGPVAPMAFPSPGAGLPVAPPVGSRRRSRGGSQKLAFAAVFLLAIGGIGTVIAVMATGPQPTDGDHAVVAPVHEDKHTGPGKERTPLPEPPKKTSPSETVRETPKASAPATAATTKPIRSTAPATRATAPESTKMVYVPPSTSKTTSPTIAPPLVKDPFPRRMMAVIPASYAFANPVAYGTEQRSLNIIFKKFAELIRIPDDQLVILSDRANNAKPPIKDVITTNVGDFLKSCRPQDRVVLAFVGHGIEKDGKGYFMPLEGDKDDPATLIPLEWFYEQLKACPAQQKVFVVDICRYDPSRGDERGKVDPMGEKFEEALKNPPEGIQVLSSCSAGQYSFELESKGNTNAELAGVEGGVMLNQIPDIAFKGGLKGVIQKPEDPIPVETLERKLEATTKTYASLILKKEQKVFLSGKPLEAKVAYDPKTAHADRFDLKLVGFDGGVAKKADILKIVQIVNDIPPIKNNDASASLNFDSLPPYSAKVLEDFKIEDQEDTELRVLIKDTIKTMRENAAVFQDRFIAPPDNPQQVNQFKDGLVNLSKQAGLVQYKLKSAQEELTNEAMVSAAEKETKYWQAAYYYTLARLTARIAYVYEYNAKLGEMRKDFPPRDPQVHNGWRLASREKMSDAAGEKDAKEAHKFLEKLTKKDSVFKGTPWELIAKRERLTTLGLEWQPNAR